MYNLSGMLSSNTRNRSFFFFLNLFWTSTIKVKERRCLLNMATTAPNIRSLSWKIFAVLHLGVHMKSNRNSWNEMAREVGTPGGLFYHQKTQLDVRQLWLLWLSLEGDTHLCCPDVHHHHGDTRQLVWIHHCPISKHQHESEKQQFHYLPPGWVHTSYRTVLVWHVQCALRAYI